MGGNNSKEISSSSSTSWGNQQPVYSTPYYDNQQYYGGGPPMVTVSSTTKPVRGYTPIGDDYASLDEVTQALARAGLESSNLIVGIDFTKSNEWTGARSFNRKSLHHISDAMNPYEHGISIIGKTISHFDDDNLIPCYGFGDATTHDKDVFSLFPNERPCNGFEEVLSRYREIVPHLRLAGPTSFAPVIKKAMTIVEESGGQYHVLLIIADGQVTSSVATGRGRFSPQEQMTIDAIVEASKYPLSIVLVGVGDGPWDMMKEFDDNIPSWDFDNFQFVNFTEIMAKNTHQSRKEAEFALAALMEIPSQYKATMELGLLGRRRGTCPETVALPPPYYNPRLSTNASSFNYSEPSHSTNFKSNPTSFYDNKSKAGSAPPEPSFGHDTETHAASSAYDNQMCPICFTNNRDMAFGCGHRTCGDCSQGLQNCPICRSVIEHRIKLF
ncbi:hypothetical protein RND81_01G018700 [Saponaria officinalis]|uniref:RING-type domain-containing protein n=1 Tax=Saponaria officinalis TaxID=3572 RepID=A0AAW1N578_SAPOF